MANFASLLFFNCRYLKLYRRRILALPSEIHRLPYALPNLNFKPCLASSVKYSSEINQFQHVPPVQNLQFANKMEDLKLSRLLKEKNINEGLIVNVFLRLVRAVHSYKHQRGFEEKLNFYLASPAFINFFQLIEKNLYKFSPSSLMTLYELYIFRTPRTEALLRKVFTVLGENLMTYSLLDRLNIYILTVRKFPSLNKCKTIIEICEDYFIKKFEDDLEYENFSYELICKLEVQELPRFVMKIIAQKLADDVLRMSCDRRSLGLFLSLMGKNYDLLPKKTFLKLIDATITFYPLVVKFRSVCAVYSDAVILDGSLYSQDVVDKIVETMRTGDLTKLISAANFVFRLGYFDDSLVKTLTEWTLEKGKMGGTAIDWQSLLSIANVFVQVSAKEMLPESVFEECIKVFENFDFFKDVKTQTSRGRLERPIDDLCCAWVTYLTYLGCDTRQLLTELFEHLKPNLIDLQSPRKLQVLHHLAKACFPSDYQSDDKLIVKLIDAERRNLLNLNFEECFDSNCVIRNCKSSDQHFLHFLAVFGPDKKPKNLSVYKKKQSEMPRNKFLNVSEINVPPGSKLIAFQENVSKYPNEFRNVPKKNGFYNLYMKAFENAGCEIVLLPPSFFNLKLEEKKEFINNKINEIFEESK